MRYLLIVGSLLPLLAFGQIDSVTVYVFLREDCVISQNYTPTLNRLYEQYRSARIGFQGVFPGSRDAQVNAFREKYKIAFPLKTDHYLAVTKKMGATITPEVIIYNNACETVLYQGRIDDTYVRVGKRKSVATTSELADALSAIINNSPIAVRKTEAIGCLITFD